MGVDVYKASKKGRRKTNIGYVRALRHWYKPYFFASMWGDPNPLRHLDAACRNLQTKHASEEILCVTHGFEDGATVYKRKGIIWYDTDNPGEPVGILRAKGKRWVVEDLPS